MECGRYTRANASVLRRRVIGILISANVQSLCPNNCIFSSSDFPAPWFSTNSEGTAPSTEGPSQDASFSRVQWFSFCTARWISCWFTSSNGGYAETGNLFVSKPNPLSFCLVLKSKVVIREHSQFTLFNSHVLLGPRQMVKLPLRKCCCRGSFLSDSQLKSPSIPFCWHFIGDVIEITVSLSVRLWLDFQLCHLGWLWGIEQLT